MKKERKAIRFIRKRRTRYMGRFKPARRSRRLYPTYFPGAYTKMNGEGKGGGFRFLLPLLMRRTLKKRSVFSLVVTCYLRGCNQEKEYFRRIIKKGTGLLKIADAVIYRQVPGSNNGLIKFTRATS